MYQELFNKIKRADKSDDLHSIVVEIGYLLKECKIDSSEANELHGAIKMKIAFNPILETIYYKINENNDKFKFYLINSINSFRK